MSKIHDVLGWFGTVAGAISWNASAGVDILAKIATIICAANLLIAWGLRAYAKLKAVRENKKSLEEAADEFEKEGRNNGKKF